MSRKKAYDLTPYNHNPAIVVKDHVYHGQDRIEVGTKIKFKDDRGVYKFRQHVDNTELDIQWIDCMDVNTGEFRSFVASRLKGPLKEKRKRVKKPTSA